MKQLENTLPISLERLTGAYRVFRNPSAGRVSAEGFSMLSWGNVFIFPLTSNGGAHMEEFKEEKTEFSNAPLFTCGYVV